MKKSSLFLAILLSVVFQLNGQSPIPPKGTVFNESEWTVDSITRRKVLRLTKNRDFNQTPTYHLNTGFSADSKSLLIATWNKEGESALVLDSIPIRIALCRQMVNLSPTTREPS